MQVAELLQENSFRAGGRDGVIVQNSPVNWIDPYGTNYIPWILNKIANEIGKKIGKKIGDELAGGSDIADPQQQQEMDKDTDNDGISDFGDQDDDNDGVLDVDDDEPKNPNIWMLPCP